MIATRSLWLAIVKDLLLLCEELILELEDLEFPRLHLPFVGLGLARCRLFGIFVGGR